MVALGGVCVHVCVHEGEILQGFLYSLSAWPAEREKETPVARSAWDSRIPLSFYMYLLWGIWLL